MAGRFHAKFSQYDPEDGGFADVWEDPEMRERATLKTQELIDKGFPSDNYSTYAKAGLELRQRMQSEKSLTCRWNTMPQLIKIPGRKI